MFLIPAGAVSKQGGQRHSGSNILSKHYCGQCTNCFRTRDCGECRVCRSGRTKEMCLNRICYKLTVTTIFMYDLVIR